jgi:hypothetical protein
MTGWTGILFEGGCGHLTILAGRLNGLLGAQRLERIQAGGAACGQPAREQRHQRR